MSKKQKKELKKILTAAVIFALLLLMEHIVLPNVPFFNRPPETMGGASEDPRMVWAHVILSALFIVPYLICGWPIVKQCFSNIKNKRFMDEAFLMTIATFGAFAIGEFSEAAAVMIFYQLGEWFQSYAVGKSRRSIKELMDIAPESAERVNDNGSIQTIDPDEVAIGDILMIKPGDKVPVDGTVLEGEGLINTAALTGESVPRMVREGDAIISGCINGESALRIRADKAYEDSTVAKILEMVENASSRKSRTENFITRFARYYTPIVVYAALALAIIPSIVTRDPATWILRACTFLVISCPCALVISVPLAFFGGIGAASNKGILVKGSNFLEQAAKIKSLVSDKTGTLTKGEFKVSEIRPAEAFEGEHENARLELLKIAAHAESLSTHPIAISIRDAYLEIAGSVKNGELSSGLIDASLVSNVENISGQGIAATVSGDAMLIGNEKLMEESGIDYKPLDDAAATAVYVAVEGSFAGSIAVSDTIKDGAAKAISELKKCGVERTFMLTGDRREVADAVARGIGIDQVYSDLMPGDKVHVVEKLIESGDVLAFVGDGINDAPVLSRADVGIAMGSMGSDAAIEAADIVIMDDDLSKLPVLMRIASKTLGISKQNIVFAIGIKVLFLILGAVGIANMWWAVFADVGVAVICILNSMRMLRGKYSA